LADQQIHLRQLVGTRTVQKVFSYVTNGADLDDLSEALRYCRRHGIRVLVAEGLSRFLRNPDWHPKKRPHLKPTLDQLFELDHLARGVSLVTVLDPDSSEERSFQTVRGQTQKGRHGGGDMMPGRMKRRRNKLLPKAVELRERGLSYRKIAGVLGADFRTVYDWLRPHCLILNGQTQIERPESSGE
jgi:DNA invertase Pin-like site-specific DNA recombinase